MRNTHDCTPKAHTPEDDDTRREPPAALPSLGDAVKTLRSTVGRNADDLQRGRTHRQDRIERVGLGRRLVGPMAQHAREAQRNAAG